jgi:predicted permease
MWPIHVPVNPDANVYLAALLLSLASGLLFGAVPIKQVLRTDPYELVKAGARYTRERRLTVRDVLLVVQIAICAVLVTSSMVAVRGLSRSLHGDFGFEPQNALLADADLTMGGYRKEALPAMQKRMVDRVAAIPGVTSVGLVDNPPIGSGANTSTVFSDSTTDLRPSNAAAEVVIIKTSPDYFRAAETSLLSGRGFTSHDDKNDPLVAVVNQEFARKIFGSAANALGHYFKKNDGTRIQIVGIVQDGKYNSLTEDPQPAMFLPLLQSPASLTYLVLRSERDPQELAAVVRSKLRELDPGLPFNIQTWTQSMAPNRFGARMAAISLGVLGVMAAMLAIIGVFGTAAYSISKRMKELGIRIALGAHRKEVLEAALGRAVKLLASGSLAGLLLGILSSRVLAYVVYQASPRDPLVLTGVVVAMALLGVLATWIPAQRALSVNPLILLREE